MSSEFRFKCDKCTAKALTHAIVGLPISTALKIGRTHGIAYTTNHLNLCETHLIGAGTEFVHVTKLELGICDQHP